MAEKLSKGRQKIEMTKIPLKSHLQVTFSKRKSGLFKKASELCTLCGANIAIIVFSPAGKIFSFGHPDVQSVVDSFSDHKTLAKHRAVGSRIGTRDRSDVIIHKLNLQLEEVLKQLEAEKKRGEILGETSRFRRGRCRWEAPISELSLCEIQQLKVSMEELKKIVESEAEQLILMESSMADGNDFGFERKFSEFHSISVVPNVHNFGYGTLGFF